MAPPLTDPARELLRGAASRAGTYGPHGFAFHKFSRALIARVLRGPDAEDYARSRFGEPVAEYLRSGVGALTSGDALGAAGAKDDEFFGLVLEQSLLGRMSGLRLVGFNVRTLRMTSGTRGYWVAEGRPIPLSKPVLQGSSLPRRKVGAIVCFTRESLEAGSAATVERFEQDLVRAAVDTLDEAFLDEGNGGIAGEMPAAVTDGTGTASAGDPGTDVETLISGFSGDLSASYFVTDPLTAAQIALARDAGGSFRFPDAGPRGGSVLGIPLLTSRGSPRTTNGGQLALVDASGIAYAMDSIEVSRSQHATLVMSDDPESSSESADFVSLFQTDTIGLKLVAHANWEVQCTGGVRTITGADYSVVQS